MSTVADGDWSELAWLTLATVGAEIAGSETQTTGAVRALIVTVGVTRATLREAEQRNAERSNAEDQKSAREEERAQRLRFRHCATLT